MPNTTSAAAPADETLGERLQRIIDTLPADALTLAELRDALGQDGPLFFAALLTLVFLIPVSIPGVSTVFGAAILFIGIFAAIQYYRNGMLDVRVAALIGVGFVFGALGGATVVPYIPQVWLKRAFATVLVYVAGQLVFADPNRKLGSVLPSVAAAASLWLIYGINRLLRRKPIAEVKSKPSDEDIDFHI